MFRKYIPFSSLAVIFTSRLKNVSYYTHPFPNVRMYTYILWAERKKI